MPVLARRAAVDAQGPRQARAGAGARSGRGGAGTGTDAETAAAAATTAPRAHAVGEVCRFEGRARGGAQVPREGTTPETRLQRRGRKAPYYDSKPTPEKENKPKPRRRAGSKDATRPRSASKDEQPKKDDSQTPRRRAGSMEKKPPRPKSERPCKYWRMGNCEKGAACQFSHGAPPSTRKGRGKRAPPAADAEAPAPAPTPKPRPPRQPRPVPTPSARSAALKDAPAALPKFREKERPKAEEKPTPARKKKERKPPAETPCRFWVQGDCRRAESAPTCTIQRSRRGRRRRRRGRRP